jgi:hypothetical protein
MSPKGLAKIIVFPGSKEPISGSLNPVHSQEKRFASTPTIVPIGGQSRIDRKFADTLRQAENFAWVLAAGERNLSIVVELPDIEALDPLMVFADLKVEIAGREKLFIDCDVLDVKIWERFERFKDREGSTDCRTCIEIMVRPSTAYALNWNEGVEHSLPAVRQVKVLAGDRPSVVLYNCFHDKKMTLRTGSKVIAQ